MYVATYTNRYTRVNEEGCNRAHRTTSKTLSSVVLPENAHIEPALTSGH